MPTRSLRSSTPLDRVDCPSCSRDACVASSSEWRRRRRGYVSKRERDRGIGKVDVAAGAGVAGEIAGKKVAVPYVHQRVTLDLPVEQQIQLLSDLASGAGRVGAQHRA